MVFLHDLSFSWDRMMINANGVDSIYHPGSTIFRIDPDDM